MCVDFDGLKKSPELNCAQFGIMSTGSITRL